MLHHWSNLLLYLSLICFLRLEKKSEMAEGTADSTSETGIIPPISECAINTTLVLFGSLQNNDFELYTDDQIIEIYIIQYDARVVYMYHLIHIIN